MNGMTFFVLWETFAKIGLLALFAQVTQTGNDGANVIDEGRDYGWQIKDGALEYIVQLSPKNAELMLTDKYEFPSNMPPELVGRATRIVVRIGTEPLPRVPSLAEIKQYPPINTADDIASALDPGKFSDVESKAVVPVQGGAGGTLNIPPLPRNGLTDSLADLPNQAGNLIDSARATEERLGQSGRDFLNGARGPTTTPDYTDTPGYASTTPNFPGISPQAPPPQSLAPANSPIVNTPATSPSSVDAARAAFEQERNAANVRAADGWKTQDPQSMPSMAGNTGVPTQSNPSQYDPRFDPRYAGTNNQAAGQGGVSDPFAPSFAGNDRMPGRPLNEGVGSGFYSTQQQYPQNQSVGTGRYDGIAGSDGTLLASRGSTLPGSQQVPSASDTETKKESEGSVDTKPNSIRRSENFLQVFFLLSLVVNFYLGMLIRKLLTRYRALLASVRGQAA